MQMKKELKEFMDRKVAHYNTPAFIEKDPVCIPHIFSTKQDIEISGFFASVFAWGKRTTIISKSRELMQLMDNQPYAFIRHHASSDLKRLSGYKHRTFNDTDLLYFIFFLKNHFQQSDSLETAFSGWMKTGDDNTENALKGFHDYFFSLADAPQRTKKHISSPEKKSGCKRLNMFLRWMVRQDNKGVDFGIWKSISPAQLICPIDVHVARVGRHLGLIKRPRTDWLAALELTGNLKTLDPCDPCKYDFALFGLGVIEMY